MAAEPPLLRKRDLPVEQVRRFLEPGPVVLLSSHWRGQDDVMTLGWHLVMEFSPSLIGCVISSANHSHELVRRSRECVINLPTKTLVDAVVGIGNCSGEDADKFEHFGLTRQPAQQVNAPLIGECHACFECRLHDTALVKRLNFFVFEVVKAHVASRPRHPQTLHYVGDGQFMVAGDVISRRAGFRPGMR